MVRGDLQNKETVGYTWSPTASMTTLRDFLADETKHNTRVQKLELVGTFLQAKVKNRVFVKLDSRYADCFLEYLNCFRRSLVLLKYVYGMTNSRKLFSGGLAEWLLEAGFIQSQYQMSIYYIYAPYGKNIFVSSYADNCVYWYNSEALGKWFVGTRKYIPFEILSIFRLVHVNNNFSYEGSFHFCESG